jgi:hypothetical protein
VSIDSAVIPVTHYIKGETVSGGGTQFASRDSSSVFEAPELDLDTLVWQRSTPGPAFGVSMAEVIDLLCELGAALGSGAFPHLDEAIALTAAVNPLSRSAIEEYYEALPKLFRRELLEFEVEQNLGSTDGWRRVSQPRGSFSVRPFPPRLVHVMPGNTPAAAGISIIRGALTRGVHLLKMPSNDLFTAPAVLRVLSELAPGHPIAQSFSAVYWRGGDEAVESIIYTPQFFDKIVAWGGQSAIRNVVKYLGPGLELVSFDPKTSASMIGAEAFAGEASLEQIAALAAADVSNQQGCTNSRIQLVEGSDDQVDSYCAELARQLAVERPIVGSVAIRTPAAIRDEVEVLGGLPGYRVWGKFDGSGLVVRSEEPLDLELTAKTVNVVPVAALSDAVRWMNIATQTVGVYPESRKLALRDSLASAGVQRIVPLGQAVLYETANAGRPHDGMYPLDRMIRWVVDEDKDIPGDTEEVQS